MGPQERQKSVKVQTGFQRRYWWPRCLKRWSLVFEFRPAVFFVLWKQRPVSEPRLRPDSVGLAAYVLVNSEAEVHKSRAPGRPSEKKKIILWLQIFAGSEYGTCCMSPFCPLECWDDPRFLEIVCSLVIGHYCSFVVRALLPRNREFRVVTCRLIVFCLSHVLIFVTSSIFFSDQ